MNTHHPACIVSGKNKILYQLHGVDGQCGASFSLDFLCNPSEGWTVNWDTRLGGACRVVDCTMSHCTHMAGIIVKDIDKNRIWRLTGDFTVNDVNQEMYEARWPD